MKYPSYISNMVRLGGILAAIIHEVGMVNAQQLNQESHSKRVLSSDRDVYESTKYHFTDQVNPSSISYGPHPDDVADERGREKRLKNYHAALLAEEKYKKRKAQREEERAMMESYEGITKDLEKKTDALGGFDGHDDSAVPLYRRDLFGRKSYKRNSNNYNDYNDNDNTRRRKCSSTAGTDRYSKVFSPFLTNTHEFQNDHQRRSMFRIGAALAKRKPDKFNKHYRKL